MFRTAPRALALIAVIAAGFFSRGDDPKPEPKGNSDPLPRGAKYRLGQERGTFTQAALLPPDYKSFVVADSFGRIRKYDLATGKSLDISVSPGSSSPIEVSADGSRAVSIRTGVISVRDVASGREVQQIKPAGGVSTVYMSGASNVSFSADGKFLAQAGTAQGGVRKGEAVVWNVDKSEVVVRILMDHDRPPIPLLSPDGKTLVTRSYIFTPSSDPGADPRRTLRVWDVPGGKERFKLEIFSTTPQLAMAFSPDSSILASAGGDGLIELWDMKTGKEFRTFLGVAGQGAQLAFSPDGATLAAVSAERTIQRWSVADGKLLGTTEPPGELDLPGRPVGIAFAGKDRIIAWGPTGATTAAWEAPSGKLLTSLSDHVAAIRSIGFGKDIVTSAQDGRILRWDAATGKRLGAVALKHNTRYSSPSSYPLHIASDASRAILLRSWSSIYDLETGAELFSVPGRSSSVNRASHSADLKWAVTWDLAPPSGKTPSRCIVWDLAEQRKRIELEFPGVTTGLPPAAAFSPSGNRLVTLSYVREPNMGQFTVLTGWDLESERRLAAVEVPDISPSATIAVASETSAVLSYAGRLTAVDYAGGRIGDRIGAAERPSSGPVVFSSDGKLFATGMAANADGQYGVRLYDWPSGRALHTFAGHSAPVTALAFSPDGKTLASGSADTTVLLWDLSELKKK